MSLESKIEEISPELFDHLVLLAALELSQDEKDYLRRQLNNQLKAIEELAAIPLDENTPPASHGIPYSAEMRPPLREDEWQPYPQPEKILKGAPDTEEGYITVPDILHTDL